ncbi:FAD-binding domain-containing protein, partial [Arthrospira platensis SPKY2]
MHWHCHFIQKLESQPELELYNMHRGYDGLRETDFDRGRFEAWCEGETGYPLVDACMAMLRETGWLNFRMRAMLMSFAAYHLWLHWREPGLHLARLFTE